MRRLRLFKVALITGLIALTSAVAGVAILRAEQYEFRKRTGLLLVDMRNLELRTGGSGDVERIIKKWGFQRQASEDKCPEEECDYILERNTPSGRLLSIFSDQWRPVVARLLTMLGSRPAAVVAHIAVRRGEAPSEYLSVLISTPDQGERGFLVGQVLVAWRRGTDSSWQRPPDKLNQYLRHSNYLVGGHVAVTNPDTGPRVRVPMVWVEFSSHADASEITRFMQLDLSCLTRFHSCQQRDLMPAVWSEMMQDERSPVQPRQCTADLVSQVAHLADTVAVVGIDSPKLDRQIYGSPQFRLPGVHMVKLIRGAKHLHFGFHGPIEVDNLEMAMTADTSTGIQAGKQYIFLLQTHMYPTNDAMALYPCGILTLNRKNLALVEDAAANPQ